MLVALLFLIGITMGAFGGILLKTGAMQIGHFEIHSLWQLFEYLFKLFTNIPSLTGVALYFFSAVTWSYLLTKLDISFVQPILALTYVATPLLAIVLLHEHVPAMRWLGILIIIIGVYVVARTAT
jgi:drug/metabolite transporter (DMT)-like permease